MNREKFLISQTLEPTRSTRRMAITKKVDFFMGKTILIVAGSCALLLLFKEMSITIWQKLN